MKDELFAEDRYLSEQLDKVTELSMYDPKAPSDEGAMAMDGATRGWILLLRAGVIR